MSSMIHALVALPCCSLGLRSQPETIDEIIFLPPGSHLKTPQSLLEEHFIQHIEHYLADPQHPMHLPLSPRGTIFQQRVWQLIRRIPAGHTRRYGELANDLSSAARAVGQACGANPFPLITPCHRVLAQTGPGGFGHSRDGWLLESKHWLLQHEGAAIS